MSIIPRIPRDICGTCRNANYRMGKGKICDICHKDDDGKLRRPKGLYARAVVADTIEEHEIKARVSA